MRPSEGHSQTEDGIGRDKSGYGKNPTEQGNLPSGAGIGRVMSGYRKKPTERGALTDCRRHWEGQVKARKESDRARGTHHLESESGGTSQDTKRIRSSEGHSQTEDSIGRDKSGYEMEATEQGELTNWSRNWEG